MNLFAFELKRRRIAIFWWVLGLSALQLFMLSFFPLMAKEQGMMDLILQYYPKEMLAAFGLANATSLGDLSGYLIFSFIFAQVALAIYASMEGFTVLSLEETENFADFLLTRPVSRTYIFVIKYGSCLLANSILALAVIASTMIGIFYFGEGATITRNILILFASLLPLQLLFFASAMAITQTMKTVRSPLTLSMGLGFGMYMLYAMRGALDSEGLRYLNYFSYLDISRILQNEGIEPVFILLTILIVFGASGISYVRYLHRNIVSK